jgi:transposase
VKQKPDITMPELAAELAARHGVEADPASLSRFLCKAGFSYKKNVAGQGARTL